MKIILGINAYHADSSACILVDGKLVAAIEEERINRIKHYSGYPIESIRECLKIAELKEDDVTDIAFNTKPNSNFLPKIFFLSKNFSIKDNNLTKKIKKKINIHHPLMKNFTLNKKVKFHFIEHHLSHLASAYYPSKFKKAYGLSIDGSGDFVTMAVAECNEKKINIKEKIFFPNSLGIFYHAMTQFLGFKNYGDEYKIMGLAAYGTPRFFNKIKNNLFINSEKKNYELNLNYFNHHNKNFKYIADERLEIDQIYSSKLLELFSSELKTFDKDQFNKDFASSVQKVYEFFFEKILTKIYKENYSKNLIFAGGCALNSSANKMITNDKKLFEKVYIPYAPGDNGGALGAAFVVSMKYNNEIIDSETPFLGKKFSSQDTKLILESEFYKKKITYSEFYNHTDLYQKAAELISQGNVIGWFQGKMEFGPRALGNRSILADPRNPEMKNIINRKIKRRESFRPFAPSIIKEFQNQWFDTDYNNPYMSSLAYVKEDKKELIPAVTHIDGTARFQTVDNNKNPQFFGLLKSFYNLTGVPVLLNTSFNENEPVVMKPEESLNCLLRTDMDAVFINNFFVKKLS